MTGSATKLEAGALIQGRYRAEEPLHTERTRRAYGGTDEQTGQRVLLLEVSTADASSLGPAPGVEHAHLAKVLDVVLLAGSAVLVAEHVAGDTLEAHASGSPPDHPVDAVRAALRIADAVSALHAAGAAHGGIRPAAVIHEPTGRAGPIVSYAPSVVGLSPYRSAGRGESGAASEADDTWAVGGLLHLLLTGKEPPQTGVASPAELERSGVTDPMLREVLAHCLAPDPALRHADLRPLKRELARWFVDHAGEEPSHHGGVPSRPPPLPPGASVPPVSSPSPVVAFSQPPVPRRKSKLWIPLALGAIVIGVGAAWGVSAMRKPAVQVVETPASASAAPAAAAGHAIDLSEVPVTGDRDSGTGDRTASCVAGYLPKGAFQQATPGFDWLCGEADPRTGAERLRTAIVFGGGQTQVTEAMKLMSRVGWYDMPIYAVVRAGCCPEAKALELPPPVEGCADMGQALREIAKNVLARQSFDEPLERYGKAANCEVAANRAYLFRHNGRPQFYQETAFRELVKAISSP